MRLQSLVSDKQLYTLQDEFNVAPNHTANLQSFISVCFTQITGLWGLVNNAGIINICPMEWAPLDTFKRMADVNLWGMIEVTKYFIPLVRKARGRVVNFSSVAGKKRTQLLIITKNS